MVKIPIDVLRDLHIFGTPKYGKVVFGMPHVCLSVCLDGRVLR
jgi:hypothetical protein